MTRVQKPQNAMVQAGSAGPSPEDYALMDQMDGEQVLAELRGELSGDMTYSFQGSDGKTVTGISLKGTGELVARVAEAGVMVIDVERIEFEYADLPLEDLDRRTIAQRRAGGKAIWGNLSLEQRQAAMDALPDVWPYVVAKAHAVDRKTGRGQWGVKKQEAKLSFSLEQATSKAERNAQRKLLPPSVVQDFVATINAKKAEAERLRAGTNSGQNPGRPQNGQSNGSQSQGQSQRPTQQPQQSQRPQPQRNGQGNGNQRASDREIGRRVMESARRAQQGQQPQPTQPEPQKQAPSGDLENDATFIERAMGLASDAGDDRERRIVLSQALAEVTATREAFWDDDGEVVKNLSMDERAALLNYLLDRSLATEEGGNAG